MKYNEIEYILNDKFSTKDFTGVQGIINYKDISGVVYASCFSQEIPDIHIFPDDMIGVTFVKCNLDNVFIPAGNTIIDCSQRRFKIQTDLNDWIIGLDNKPIEPIDKKIFVKFGLPVPDPKDIPIVKVDKRIDLWEVAKTKQVMEVIK